MSAKFSFENISVKDSKCKKSNESKDFSNEVIEQVKRRFLDEYEVNKNLYDEEDIDRIKRDNFFIRRFVNFNNQGPEKGFEQMKKAYRWRKSFGMNNWDQLLFPKELYQMGGMFSYPPDKEGNLMLYIRGKMHRKIEIVYDIIKQYLVYHMNKLDLLQSKERSWCVVVDATDTGFDNADIHMALFTLDTLRKYFPMGIKYFVIYGMPFLLNTFANFALAMMPGYAKQLIKFWGPKELKEHVDENSLPDFLGGNCKECYRRVPKGALDIYYLAKRDYNLEKEEVDKLLKPSLKYIDTENWVEVENV